MFVFNGVFLGLLDSPFLFSPVMFYFHGDFGEKKKTGQKFDFHLTLQTEIQMGLPLLLFVY